MNKLEKFLLFYILSLFILNQVYVYKITIEIHCTPLFNFENDANISTRLCKWLYVGNDYYGTYPDALADCAYIDPDMFLRRMKKKNVSSTNYKCNQTLHVWKQDFGFGDLLMVLYPNSSYLILNKRSNSEYYSYFICCKYTPISTISGDCRKIQYVKNKTITIADTTQTYNNTTGNNAVVSQVNTINQRNQSINWITRSCFVEKKITNAFNASDIRIIKVNVTNLKLCDYLSYDNINKTKLYYEAVSKAEIERIMTHTNESIKYLKEKYLNQIVASHSTGWVGVACIGLIIVMFVLNDIINVYANLNQSKKVGECPNRKSHIKALNIENLLKTDEFLLPD